MAAALREIIHLLETTRARQVRLTTSQRTLREMERLPPHLIDDVNAHGLPLDHHVENAHVQFGEVIEFPGCQTSTRVR
jgi:hypothetical protein